MVGEDVAGYDSTYIERERMIAQRRRAEPQGSKLTRVG